MTRFFNAHGTNPNLFSGQFQDLTFGHAPTDMLAGRSWVSIDELIDTHDEPIFDPDELDIDIDMLDTLWSTPFLGSDYDMDDRYDDAPELPGIAMSLKGEVFFHEDYPLFGSYAELETVAPSPLHEHWEDDDFFFEVESDLSINDWLGAEMRDVDDNLHADHTAEEEVDIGLTWAEFEQETKPLMPSFSGCTRTNVRLLSRGEEIARFNREMHRYGKRNSGRKLAKWRDTNGRRYRKDMPRFSQRDDAMTWLNHNASRGHLVH